MEERRNFREVQASLDFSPLEMLKTWSPLIVGGLLLGIVFTLAGPPKMIFPELLDL